MFFRFRERPPKIKIFISQVQHVSALPSAKNVGQWLWQKRLFLSLKKSPISFALRERVKKVVATETPDRKN